jgi:hypothetical protein
MHSDQTKCDNLVQQPCLHPDHGGSPEQIKEALKVRHTRGIFTVVSQGSEGEVRAGVMCSRCGQPLKVGESARRSRGGPGGPGSLTGGVSWTHLHPCNAIQMMAPTTPHGAVLPNNPMTMPEPEFFIMWVEGSEKPPTKKFYDEGEVMEHAADFTRRIQRPVHVLKVVATVRIEPKPVQVMRYARVVEADAD